MMGRRLHASKLRDCNYDTIALSKLCNEKRIAVHKIYYSWQPQTPFARCWTL